MAFRAKVFALKANKPVVSKVIGDVIDVLPFDIAEGTEIHKHYVVIEVTDMSEDLAEEFKLGVKRLKQPSIRDGLVFNMAELQDHIEVI